MIEIEATIAMQDSILQGCGCGEKSDPQSMEGYPNLGGQLFREGSGG